MNNMILRVFTHISERIMAGDWKRLGRRLGLSDAKLNNLETDSLAHSEGPEQKYYAMLQLWMQKNPLGTNEIINTLAEALRYIRRVDIAEEIMDIQTGADNEIDHAFSVPHGNSVDLSRVEDIICTNISNKWKSFGRHLRISDEAMNRIEVNCRNSNEGIEECCHQLLNTWKQKYPNDVSVQKLIEALTAVERVDLAEMIEDVPVRIPEIPEERFENIPPVNPVEHLAERCENKQPCPSFKNGETLDNSITDTQKLKQRFPGSKVMEEVMDSDINKETAPEEIKKKKHHEPIEIAIIIVIISIIFLFYIWS